MGRPWKHGGVSYALPAASAEWVFLLGASEDQFIKVAQLHASDVLKRRWPNRYVSRPMVSLDDCVKGLVEMGAMSKELIDLSNKRIAFAHWFIGHLDARKSNSTYDDKSFYRTMAWRKVRFSVLSNSGGKCAACGASPKDGASLHVDHIKPRSKHPELALDPANLQVLCGDCNIGKADGPAVSFG